jgi:hypothetical protein
MKKGTKTVDGIKYKWTLEDEELCIFAQEDGEWEEQGSCSYYEDEDGDLKEFIKNYIQEEIA